MNLIFVTVDALRADHLGCYGYHKKITPNIDKLANSGLLFVDANSVSCETSASFVSIFSATYPSMYRSLNLHERQSFVEVLKQSGYKTIAIHCNPFISRIYGFEKGFDIFLDDLTISKNISFLQRVRSISARFIRKARYLNFARKIFAKIEGRMYKKYNLRADDINNIFYRCLKNLKNSNKFFVWLHYMDMHFPWLPPEEYIPNDLTKMDVIKANFSGNMEDPIIKELYDASLNYFDEAFSILMEKLEEYNLLDETYIVLTSDHGEDFGEHGLYSHNVPSLYEERIRVPLIIYGPGIKKGKINMPVSLIDIAPTILHILVGRPKFQFGLSLLTYIENQRYPPVFSEAGKLVGLSESLLSGNLKFKLTHVSLKKNSWKYIHKLDGEDEFFNLKLDPCEKDNIIVVMKDFAKEFYSEIENHITTIKKFNNKFLNENYPTDVISFEGNIGEGSVGDVVICVDKAVEYSAQNNMDVNEELARYVVHGILHCLGYEDIIDKERRTMFKRQEELLKEWTIRNSFSVTSNPIILPCVSHG